MTLLSLPIPPKPDSFTPEGAPPGIAVDLEAYGDWTYTRPPIIPRLIVVHTNGAGNEGSLSSAVNWSNASPSNTHAHYNINAPTPTKHLSTGLRSIANSTPPSMEKQYGESDVSYWSISIETADRGYNNGGGVDLGDFLYDHAELVARIIAYESIVWDIPIELPSKWNGEGVVPHTGLYPGYTTVSGKTCPGTTKRERILNGDILPRAQQLRNGWTKENPEMFEPYLYGPPTGYNPKTSPVFLVQGTSARTLTGKDVELFRDGNGWKLPFFADKPEHSIRYDLVHKTVVGEEPLR